MVNIKQLLKIWFQTVEGPNEKKDSNSKVEIYIFIQNELNTIVSSLLDPQQISGVLGCDQCYISSSVQASTSVYNLPAMLFQEVSSKQFP